MLTPYTTTLTDEAERRGIRVTFINEDPDLPIFDLCRNGERVRCFNALTDRVGAATYHLVNHKRACHEWLARQRIPVPAPSRPPLSRHKKKGLSMKPASALIAGALCSALFARSEPSIEYRYLDGLAGPKRWSPAECEVTVSPHRAWEHPVACMRIPVDFHAGEKAYPIGWPRMYLSLDANEQGWFEYDRFEFQLYTESSRERLPARPVTFHLYDTQGQKKLIVLEQAALKEWRTVSVNLSDLGLAGPVARLGFNINESDYSDKDWIAFHVGGFRLARATAPHVTELRAVTPALFCDCRVLPIELVIEGPAAQLASGIPVHLRTGSRTVLTRTLPVTRGRQTLYVPLDKTPLTPGAYTVTVNPDADGRGPEAAISFTTTPWQ